MKRAAISVAVGLLATALIVGAMTNHAIVRFIPFRSDALGLTFGFVLLAVAILIFLTTFDQGRTASVLRLDWFSPALRRLKDRSLVSHSLPGRMFRQLLPAS